MDEQTTHDNEPCFCDRTGLGAPGVSCGDCPTRDYKKPAGEPVAQGEPVAEVAGRSGSLYIVFLPAGRSLGLGDKLYAAPAAPVAPDREAFEAWIRSDSTLPIDEDEHGYTDMTTALMWHAWQAAQKANAPEGAFVGGSDANARLCLAGPDSSCSHEFQLQPSSGIRLCAHCGLSEVAAKRAAPVAPVAQGEIAAPKAAQPPVDYDALVPAAYALHGYAAGTKQCIAFKRGAEWQADAAHKAPSAPVARGEPVDQHARDSAELRRLCAERDRLRKALSDKRAIFQAGRDSYETACSPMNSDEEAWQEYVRAHGIIKGAA